MPGSAGAVRAEAFDVGSLCGALLADIEAGLEVVQKKWSGKSVWDTMTAAEKAAWAQQAATRFDKLPHLRQVDTPELAAAQEDGFNSGVESAYALGKIQTFVVNIGADIAIAVISAVAAGGLLTRLLTRTLGRAAVVLGGEGETMTLYRYAKAAEDVQPRGWWTSRQAATRAEAARLTGVPENECLFEQRVTVNAAPSKYEGFFEMPPARSVGDALVVEFRNKVLIPKSVITVKPMPQ